MISPRMAKPMPAAISVKKLAQKSIMSLKVLPAPPCPGGAPAAIFEVLLPDCRGSPGEMDSDFSAMSANSWLAYLECGTDIPVCTLLAQTGMSVPPNNECLCHQITCWRY